jgi:hypothetical protein
VVPRDEPGLSTVGYFSFARVAVHHTRGNDNRVFIEGGAQLGETKRVTVLSSLRRAEQIVGRLNSHNERTLTNHEEITPTRHDVLSIVRSMHAQQQTEQPRDVKTKLEAFQAKTGVVIIRGFSEIGTTAGMYGTSVKVESKEFTEATTGRREYGITVEVKGGGRLERENTSYVDYDEIDSLIKGIDYIAKIDSTVTKLNNFQADYKTKDDLSFSTFSSQGEVLFGVQSGRIGPALAYFNMSKLPEIRDLIVSAKAKLDSIRTPAR